VIVQPGRSVTEAELIEFCRQGLAAVKRPRKVVFTDAYPTTATGKVRRVELRRMAAAVLGSGQEPAEAGRPGATVSKEPGKEGDDGRALAIVRSAGRRPAEGAQGG
jgi:hypothetical protein